VSRSQRKAESIAQGGKGRSLRSDRQIQRLLVPVNIGESPGPGTMCSVFMHTQRDPAYSGAQVDFIVVQNGRETIFKTLFIDPAVLAVVSDIQMTASGCAASWWKVQITLNNAVLPTTGTLQSTVVASGVENIAGSSQSQGGFMSFSATVTVPGGGGSVGGGGLFSIPFGTSTFMVTGTQTVVTAGGAGEAVGDSYMGNFVGSWKNLVGVASVLAPQTGQEWQAFDASMPGNAVTGAFFGQGAIGAQAEVVFATAPLLDVGTVVRITINMLPLSLGS
jgi:hypothetical protein